VGFARLLVHGGVNSDADERVREVLIKKRKQLRDNCAVKDAERGIVVRDNGKIEVDIMHVATGQMNVTGRTSARMSFPEENIDQLFDIAGRLLAAGEDLHRTYRNTLSRQREAEPSQTGIVRCTAPARTILFN